MWSCPRKPFWPFSRLIELFRCEGIKPMEEYQETSQDVSASQQPLVKKKSIIREYAESIVIAVLLALVIRTYLVQAFKIPSGSMEDTLAVGDHLLVNKFIYGTKIPFSSKSVIRIRD